MILLTQTGISNITLGELGVYIALIIAILKVIYEFIKWLSGVIKYGYKKKKCLDKKDETLENHTKQIAEMDIRHKEDYAKLNEKLDKIIESIDTYQEENKQTNDKIRRATIEQMSSDITNLCEKYLERKSIESYELTALINQFTVYEEIGGNHGVYELVDKVKLLPVEHKHKSI